MFAQAFASKLGLWHAAASGVLRTSLPETVRFSSSHTCGEGQHESCGVHLQSVGVVVVVVANRTPHTATIAPSLADISVPEVLVAHGTVQGKEERFYIHPNVTVLPEWHSLLDTAKIYNHVPTDRSGYYNCMHT